MSRKLLLAGPILTIAVGEAVQAVVSESWIRFAPFVMAGLAAAFILIYLLLENRAGR